MYNVLYETTPWHKRAALFDETGKLILFKFYEESRSYIEGAVVLGRVRKIAQGINAAFVDIGDVTDGFLPLKTVPKNHPKLTEGSRVLVRVARSGMDGKGARLDARCADKMPPQSTPVPSLVRPAPGPLQRILQEAGDTPVQFWVPNDASYNELLDLIPEAKERIYFTYKNKEDQPFDIIGGLEEGLDAVFSPTFPLSNGGRITIEGTAALTAIDLDSGAFYGIGEEAGVVNFNLAAVPEIARLIRLLDIGGNMIVDFITMKQKKDRQVITRALEDAFATTDMRHVEIFSMSRFGLVEINREKTGASRMELFKIPAFIAGRILLQLARSHTSYKKPIHLQAAPEVANILKSRLTRDVCLSLFGQEVNITASQMPATQWQLSTQ